MMSNVVHTSPAQITFAPHCYNRAHSHSTKVYLKCIMMHCLALTVFEIVLHFSAQLVIAQYHASLRLYDAL